MSALKSLTQHVFDKTFRPSRHHELLAGPAVGWRPLAAIQADYVAATSEPERRAVAVTFLEALRELDAPDEEARAEINGTTAAAFAEIFNLPPVPMRIAGDQRACDQYYRAMSAAALYDGGVPVREVAERLGLELATVQLDLRFLDQFDLPTWLRAPRAAGDMRSVP